MDLNELDEPFYPDEIEWRISNVWNKDGEIKAKCLAYVTNRAIQNRLDSVCGKGNWENKFKHLPDGVMCGIRIYLDDDHTKSVVKWDGAPPTDYESFKGGISDSMKRAGCEWGIGRYLHNLSMGWANVHKGGIYYHSPPRDKKSEYPPFKWDPPSLPRWALPRKPKEIERGEEEPIPFSLAKQQPEDSEPSNIPDIFIRLENSSLNDVEKKNIQNEYNKKPDHLKKPFESFIDQRIKSAKKRKEDEF